MKLDDITMEEIGFASPLERDPRVEEVHDDLAETALGVRVIHTKWDAGD